MWKEWGNVTRKETKSKSDMRVINQIDQLLPKTIWHIRYIMRQKENLESFFLASDNFSRLIEQACVYVCVCVYVE